MTSSEKLHFEEMTDASVKERNLPVNIAYSPGEPLVAVKGREIQIPPSGGLFEHHHSIATRSP
jgi:hypothetical protein